MKNFSSGNDFIDKKEVRSKENKELRSKGVKELSQMLVP